MLLKSKTQAKSVMLRVRIPGDLLSQIEDVRRRAAEHGLVLDVNDVCSAALVVAVKQADRELAKT